MARILNCSRQNINDKLKKESQSENGTWLKQLDPDEESKICGRIQNRKDSETNVKFSFALITANTNPYEKALILRNCTKVKVAFELPKAIENALKMNNLDIFTAEELQIVDNLDQFGKTKVAKCIMKKNVSVLKLLIKVKLGL